MISKFKLFIIIITVIGSSNFFTQPVSLTVDYNRIIQEDFLGINAVYHGFSFMPEQQLKGMDILNRKKEFEHINKIRLNIARTWYGIDWATYNPAIDSFEWNSEKMQAFYSWLAEMKNLKVDVALSLGWWFSDTYFKQVQPSVESKKRFAKWVSESLYELIVRRGFDNIKYGFLFTEPNNQTPPVGYSWWKYYKEIVILVDSQLIQDKRRNLIKIVGPNTSENGKYIETAVKELNNVLDVYSGHNYNMKDYYDWFSLVKSLEDSVQITNKQFWLDEYGHTDSTYRTSAYYADYIAQAILASINSGSQTSFIWTLFDQQFVYPLDDSTSSDYFYKGVHHWGTRSWPYDNSKNESYPYLSWYAFSIMSRYFPGRRNTKIYYTTNAENVFLSASESEDAEYSFILINGNSAEAKDVSINLVGKSINSTLRRYLYDPAKITLSENKSFITFDKVFNNVKNFISDSLPPKSIAVYSNTRDF